MKLADDRQKLVLFNPTLNFISGNFFLDFEPEDFTDELLEDLGVAVAVVALDGVALTAGLAPAVETLSFNGPREDASRGVMVTMGALGTFGVEGSVGFIVSPVFLTLA